MFGVNIFPRKQINSTDSTQSNMNLEIDPCTEAVTDPSLTENIRDGMNPTETTGLEDVRFICSRLKFYVVRILIMLDRNGGIPYGCSVQYSLVIIAGY